MPVSPVIADRCFHCAEACPPHSRWRARVGETERVFCCAGCLAVARTIGAAGLAAFYRNRENPTPRPAEAGRDTEWAISSEAAAAVGVVRALPNGQAEASLLLEGMTCGACAWLVERWLARQPGVADAGVNFATRRAHVAFDPARTGLATLLGAVASIGYRAHPYDPARREMLARREKRALLTRAAVALLAMMQVMMFAVPTYLTIEGIAPEHQRLLDWASLTLTLPVILYSAAPFFRGAWRDLVIRRPGMDVPVALGLGAAFAASAWSTFGGGGPVYYDSITMFVALLLSARYLELAARQRGAAAIETLARVVPEIAYRLRDWPHAAAGDVVPASALAPGDLVAVRSGATIPADGEVVEGRSYVEEAILTGESRPLARAVGDRVLAGSVNRESALVVRVLAAGEATRAAAIARLADRAACVRPRLAQVADRVAAWFVGGLLIVAAATALYWSIVDPSRAFAVTFALLVVSCPCALSLATPAALSAAAGALARRHVVLARPDAIEALAHATHIVLDKTGTLTDGRFRLLDVVVLQRATRATALSIAAALERSSEHPIARAICAASDATTVARETAMTAGQGIEGTVDGVRWRIGHPAFVAALSGAAPMPIDEAAATVVALGDGHGVVALLRCADAPRDDAPMLIDRLRALRIVPIVLSGDRSPLVSAVGAALGIADARGDLMPEDKRAAIADLQRRGAVVAMAGDGVNDAPALAQAHVSISLASGTPLAQATADLVVLSPALLPVAEAFAHARRTLAVIRQNLGWALVYNAIAIPAAAFGWVTPLLAAAGMSLSSVVVVANALRLAHVRPSLEAHRFSHIPQSGTRKADAQPQAGVGQASA